MRVIAGSIAAIILLSACSSAPKEPVRPDGQNRVQVNSPEAIAEAMAGYYRTLRLAKLKSEPKKVTTRLTVKEILEKHVPANMTVFTDDAIDLSSPVEYETSKAWVEALGDALTEIDVAMTADLEKRVMTLKPAKLSVAKILEKYAPSDFTVYADESVDMNTATYFDRSKGWTEALGKALSAVDISSTINLSKKLIVLKPRAVLATKLQAGSAPAAPASIPSSTPSKK